MKKNEIDLSIVIPVYNGAQSIGRLVEELFTMDFNGKLEVVLVNDGSPDNSAEVCESLSKDERYNIVFVDLSRNFGEHNAVMAGYNQSNGNYVITIDDDFQNPPSEVKKLYEYCCENSFDVVYTYYKKKKHSFFRNLGSKSANYVANLMLDKPKDLYLSSFRCVNKMVVEAICNYEGPFPYVDGLILQVTQNIGKIQVNHSARQEGESNYTLRRLVRLWLIILLNFSSKPLRFSAVLGIIVFFFGLIGAAQVTLEWLLQGTPPGYGSIMTTILLFCGTQLLMIGVVGEYVGRIFQTINGKPQFYVRKTLGKK